MAISTQRPVLQRPILWGGLGLTFGVWLLDQAMPIVPDEVGTAFWSTIALGSGIWFLKKQRSRQSAKAAVKPFLIDRTKVMQAIATTEIQINQLVAEISPVASPVSSPVSSSVPSSAPTSPAIEGQPEATATLSEAAFAQVSKFRERLGQIHADLDRSEVRLAVVGRKNAGKSTVAQFLNTIGVESSVDDKGEVAAAEVVNTDVILFTVTGDLTEGEFAAIQTLVRQHHRVLVVINKLDQVLPTDRAVVVQQVRDRLTGLLATEDAIGVIAQPAAFKVRQYQADGSVQERLEQAKPEVDDLKSRLAEVLTQEHAQLVLTTAFRQVEALKSEIQTALNLLRRQRALPIIEQYQWIAATAAFANPVPSLDVLATATINAQLIVDLGKVYQQSFSLEQAKTVTMTLGAQMVKLGLVEMASSAIAPLLKSTALTYVAGGLLQGLSAAYLTQLAGLTMVEYFQEVNQTATGMSSTGFQIDRLVDKLKAVFQDNQRTAFMQNLVKQGMAHLIPETLPQALGGAKS